MEDRNSGDRGAGERDRAIVDELRELGRSFSALGRTVFEEGRVLSADLLKSAREAVDRARTEIEKMAREKR